MLKFYYTLSNSELSLIQIDLSLKWAKLAKLAKLSHTIVTSTGTSVDS